MSDNARSADVVVVGAGIAGVSAAYELARRGAAVILAEMEDDPGYHTTGRSAATFVGCYGNEVIRAISAASRPFLEQPQAGFAEPPILADRGALYVAGADQMAALDAFLAEPPNAGLLERLSTAEAIDRAPVLKQQAIAGAAFEASAQDIDVNALMQGYLRGFRAAGGVLVTRAGVGAMLRRFGQWELETPAGRLAAPVVVNAAGAWGDEVAALAGTRPVGLVPKRRTALTIDPGCAMDGWPLTISLDETWYFRPEAGDLLISPADETPSPPCDCQPDETDIAECVDRIQRVTTLDVRRLVSKRAGLRTFVHDKSPVLGFADDVDGFFWLAGQGGYGIQTAPVMADLAATLIGGGHIPEHLEVRGVTDRTLGPARLTAPMEELI